MFIPYCWVEGKVATKRVSGSPGFLGVYPAPKFKLYEKREERWIIEWVGPGRTMEEF